MFRFLILMLIITGIGPSPAIAAQPRVMVAVAANFHGPMEKIARLFEESTGITVVRSYSSTGRLYAQIKNGAPFDLFLAADCERPERLQAEGLAEKPMVYAQGEVVLWSADSGLVASSWREAITDSRVKQVALPMPEAAPYGRVAVEAIKSAGLWEEIESRLVYGQNVAQTFQYGSSHSVEASFTSLSYALTEEGRQGHFWRVEEAAPVVQKGCVLMKGVNTDQARRFMAFLTGEKTRAIVSGYGYK